MGMRRKYDKVIVARRVAREVARAGDELQRGVEQKHTWNNV